MFLTNVVVVTLSQCYFDDDKQYVLQYECVWQMVDKRINKWRLWRNEESRLKSKFILNSKFSYYMQNVIYLN